MNKSKNIFTRIWLYLFFLSLFLLRMPPLYYLGIFNFKSIFFTTHTLSILILMSLSLIFFFRVFKKSMPRIDKYNLELIFILFFFLTQSLSSIPAQNIFIFLQRYSKIVIGFLIFILVRFLIPEKKFKDNYSKIIKIFILGGVITCFFQLLLLVFPNLYFNLADFFIYTNVLSITKAHYIGSGKMFDDTYLEIAIPFLFYFLLEKRKNIWPQIFLITMIVLIGVIAFFSNFRYRLVGFIFSLLAALYLFKKNKFNIKSYFFKTTSLLFIIFFILQIISFLLPNFGYSSILDRFTLQTNTEGFGTIKSRIDTFSIAIDFANKNPLGVGLGNFYDNLLDKRSLLQSFFGSREETSRAALESGPHNIFFQILAESGYLGLISFLALLIYLIIKDYKLIRIGNNKKITLIIAFYTLMVIVQFVPAINLTFYFLFFFLRSLI